MGDTGQDCGGDRDKLFAQMCHHGMHQIATLAT